MAIDTGTLTVTLTCPPGQYAGILSGNSGDPEGYTTHPHAIITKVSNYLRLELALAHMDARGQTTGFLILPPSTATDAFDGMEVEGSWTAQLGGDVAQFPASAGIQVEWRSPEYTKPNQPPLARLSATPQSGLQPLEVTFDARGSYDPDGSIAKYELDFGDGVTASGSFTQHVYQGCGTFNARLTVTDNSGATGSTTAQIKVDRRRPSIYAEPSWVDFGDVDIGSTSPPRQVVLRNSGSETADLTLPEPAPGCPFNWQVLSRALAPGESATLDFSFMPAALGPVTELATVTWVSADRTERGGTLIHLAGAGRAIPLATPEVTGPADGAHYPLADGQATLEVSLSWQPVAHATGYVIRMEEYTDILGHVIRPPSSEPKGPLTAPTDLLKTSSDPWKDQTPPSTGPAGYQWPPPAPVDGPPPLPAHRWDWVPHLEEKASETVYTCREAYYATGRTLRWSVAAVDDTGLYLASQPSPWRQITIAAGASAGGAGGHTGPVILPLGVQHWRR